MNYKEAEDILYSIPMFQNIGEKAYNPSLEAITTLCSKIGNPQRKFSSIHVAGTNGKGSVSHLISATLTKAGYKTALFTSPHLLTFRERMKIDSAMVSEDGIVMFMELYKEVIEELKPSFFELTTAMAFWWFAYNKVDIAVVECGLGGRLDATNIIKPLLCIITNISLDHCSILGNTLEEIAIEKSGIIKESTPLIVGEWDNESSLAIMSRAKEIQADVYVATQRYMVVEGGITDTNITTTQTVKYLSLITDQEVSITTDLRGFYQQKNIATALSALDVLTQTSRIEVTWQDIKAGFVNSGLSGRWQQLSSSPTVVCDTAHNLAGITEVVKQLSSISYNKLYMVLVFVSDKDISSITNSLPKDAEYIFTQSKVARALEASTLADTASHSGLNGVVVNDIAAAIKLALKLAQQDDFIYIGGSTFTVAEALEYFKS